MASSSQEPSSSKLSSRNRPSSQEPSSSKLSSRNRPTMVSSSQQPSSASTSIRKYNFDVFLSFRGEDTRYQFTDHLFANLERKGIRTFRDDQVERAEKIKPELSRSIEESRISVVVFSTNYAHSKWCLDELAKIMKCREEMEQIVLPVFYHVIPSDVRHQRGRFGEAFSIHERNVDAGKVQRWRDSLTEASNLSGFDVNDGYESTHIEKITNRVLEVLNPKHLHTDDHIVGMDFYLKEVKSLLSSDCKGIRVIGIYGTSGIGKTTIAKIVYNEFQGQFTCATFLQDVRERSKNGYQLQLQLLQQLVQDTLGRDVQCSNINEATNIVRDRLGSKKIFIVIDDVEELKQLESLAGSPKWFGSGSMIIITTRDQRVLIEYGVNKQYKVNGLNDEDALKLFCRYAFKQNVPKEGYVDLSNRMVKYAQGLPLALTVLGSSLHDMKEDEWESALKNWKKNPPKRITDVLRKSFDGLHHLVQEVFLDIVCFFKGKSKDFATGILDGCNFHAKDGMRVLSDKCLITLSGNIIGMHDLLQDMGWEIVREKSPREPGKWSRLWDLDDIYPVLTRNTGTENIEGIILDLDMPKSKQIEFTTKAFKMMKKLRLLKVHQDAKYELVVYPEAMAAPEVQYFSGDFEFPSYELRYLHWDGYPMESLPSNFHGEELVELRFRSSNIKQLFQENKLLEKLKVVDLSYSQHLIEIPNISNIPNLEILILKGCKNLENLPNDICELKYLTTLRCSGCIKLEIFPEIKEDMENLRELHLDGTSIQELPSSVERLKGLEYLDLSACSSLLSLPDSICNLRSLKTLEMSGCSVLQKLPENLENLQCLEKFIAAGAWCQLPYLSGLCSLIELDVRYSNLRQGAILSDISCFYSLEILDLSYCDLVEDEILTKICHLSMLEKLDLSGNHFSSLPAGISQLSKLRALGLNHCNMLQEIPELPSSLRQIVAHDCACLETLSSTPPLPWQRQLWWSLFYCFKSQFQDLECRENQWFKWFTGKGINIVVPGNCGIPNWIRNQNMGNIVTMELPMNWHEHENILGFVVCCLYVPVSQSDGRCTFGCKLSFNGDQIGFTDSVLHISFCNCYEEYGSDQVWYCFYPKIGIPMEYRSNQWRNLEATFYSELPRMEKCGVDLVYDREDESAAVDTNVNIKRSLEGAGNNLAEDPYNKRLRGPDPDHETQNSPELNQESSLLSSYQLFNFL